MVDLYNEALNWAKDIRDVYSLEFTLVLKANPKLEEISDHSSRIDSIGKNQLAKKGESSSVE